MCNEILLGNNLDFLDSRVMKSKMKYQGRLTCFLTFVLASASVNMHMHMHINGALNCRKKVQCLFSPTNPLAESLLLKNLAASFDYVRIAEAAFFSQKFCSMAAVNNHKHPCRTFWRDNIINKGSELLMMRPSFLCGCLD